MRRRVLCGIVLTVGGIAALAPGLPAAAPRPATAPATRPGGARAPATAPAMRPLWPIPSASASASAAAPATRPAAPATQPAAAAATRPTVPSTQPALAAATQPAAPATQPVATASASTTRPAATQPILASAIASAPPSPRTRPAVKVPAQLPDRPLTMDELQSLFEDGRYPDLLKSVNRVLGLKGKAAGPYDRYDVLAMKAETHLRMKAIPAAIFTFTQMGEETKDPQRAALAKATVALIKKSRNFFYAPTSGKGRSSPIDIVDPASRRKALRQLLADELAAATPKIEKALDGRSLAAVAEALRSLQGIDVLERAAQGDDQESKQLAQELRDRGNAVMAKALQQMSKAVDEISKAANEMQEVRMTQPLVGGGTTESVRYRKRGLSREDVGDLKAVIATCEEIAPNAAGLAHATGGKEKDIENLVDAADELARRADKVLKAEYR